MKRSYRSWVVAVGLAASVFSLDARAAELRDRVPRPGEFNPAHRTVEFFEAIDDGLVEARIIPRNDREARVFVANKTNEPLNVQLPEAFGLVPNLGQCCGGCCIGGGGGGAQSGGGGGGGGFFNIPADQERDLERPIVCLEHGKADPRAAIPYKLVPIDTLTDSPELVYVLEQLGKGKANHRAVQVIAWHVASGMSWEKLATKEIKHLGGLRELYFHPGEIIMARNLFEKAKKAVEERKNEDESAPADDTRSYSETPIDE